MNAVIAMRKHFDAVRGHLCDYDADAALISFMPNIRWASGFTGSNALLLVDPHAAHFLSDGRYASQAQREVRDAHIHIPEGSLLQYAAEENLIDAGARVLFQADHVTVAKREQFAERFPSVEWIGVSELLVEEVAAKAPNEIEHIRAAQSITDGVFAYLCDWMEPGMAERAIAAEIVYQHLQRGAERMAFEPIVASGPNASLPHARPTRRKLQNGDLVVIDMGGVVDGYASDMTRTVAVGDPGNEARAHYRAVREAQTCALDAARSGMTGKALDTVARDALDDAGLGDYFTHSLGHGIGLQTHEWPRLSQRVEHVLPEGATVTIEPGVYVRERHGIRIEDIVVLRPDGCENLTQSSKALIML